MDLEALAAEFVTSAAAARVEVAAVVAKGALNVKNEARANAAASARQHARLYPGTIGYDVALGGLAAEVGPATGGKGSPNAQGNYGFLEYGSLHSPPHRDLGRALDAEEPRFLQALSDVLPWD